MRGAGGFGRLARLRWVRLQGGQARRVGSLGHLTVALRSPLREDHKAEEMANGRVGSPNQ
jgi:hypothetical protein